MQLVDRVPATVMWPAAVAPRADRSRAVIALATGIALMFRGYRLTRPGVLFGVGDDDGVYFAAATRLLHGALPYRDYVLVHPPLIAVLLAPFAALGHVVGTSVAFATARWATVVVGAGAVVVLGRLLRRFGTPAVVVGCGVLALHGSAVVSGETIYLEPYAVLALLIGLLVAFDGGGLANPRRQLVGAGLVGLACAVKIWAFVPAVVLAGVALSFPAAGSRRRNQFARVCAGITAGFAVPVLPFAVVAPSQFFHDVFAAQLERHGPRTGASARAASLLGMGYNQHGSPGVALVAGAAIVAVVLTAYTWWLRRCRARWDAFTVFALVSAALVAAMFFVPDTYYWHYGGFFAPFFAIVLARPVPQLLAIARRRARSAVLFVAAGAAVVFAFATAPALGGVPGTSIPVADLDARIPPGACVVTTNISVTIVLGRLTSSGPCPQLVDAYGIELATTRRSGPATQSAPRLRAYWVHVLARSQYLLLYARQLGRLPWPAIKPLVQRDFHRLPLASTRFVLWERNR